MRFYWLIDRMHQNQLTIYWKPGFTNLGNYHSKHHTPGNHQKMHPIIFNSAYNIQEIDILRGCNNNLLTNM